MYKKKQKILEIYIYETCLIDKVKQINNVRENDIACIRWLMKNIDCRLVNIKVKLFKKNAEC